MSWFSDLLTGGIGELLETGRKIIDDLNTSEEEKLEAHHKLEAMFKSYQLETLKLVAQYDREVTERHKNDMNSDSWLSKNIRPLMVAVTGGNIYLLAWATVFADLSKLQSQALEAWIPMLVGLFGTMITFYFGSRGIEKVQKMKVGKP